MRKIFLFMMVSLDGYFEGINHDLSWHHVDAEFNTYAIEQTGKIDMLLFGRRTYQLMEDYWPKDAALRDDPQVAALMNNTPKIVFSKTLTQVHETEHWKNVRLVKDNAIEEVKKLKQMPVPPSFKNSGEAKKDIAIYGSNMFAVSLLEAGLLDEVRVIINPVVVGAGTPLFAGIKSKLELKFISTPRTFKNGNVLLCYSAAPRK